MHHNYLKTLKTIFTFALSLCQSDAMEKDADNLSSFKKAVTELQTQILDEYPPSRKVSCYDKKGLQNKENYIKKTVRSHKLSLLPHLLRPYEEAQFDAEGALHIGQEERDFYHLMEEHGFFVSYRGEPATNPHWMEAVKPESKNFYKSGTPDHLLINRLKEIETGQFCQVGLPMDIYKIRELLSRFESNKPAKTDIQITAPILLIPNFKDVHSTLTAHILDLENKRVLSSIFINSLINDQYYQYIEQRFNDTMRYPSSIPFIDCSFNLQTEENDLNDPLYGYSYTVALTKLLNDQTIADQVMTAGKILFTDPKNEDAQTTLRSIFKDQVIAYLPQYYNTDGSRRINEELKDYHMRLRWQLSGQWLNDFFNSDE